MVTVTVEGFSIRQTCIVRCLFVDCWLLVVVAVVVVAVVAVVAGVAGVVVIVERRAWLAEQTVVIIRP